MVYPTVSIVGLSVSVTGERYGRETVGTIATAAIDLQHYSSTQLHKHSLSAVQLL